MLIIMSDGINSKFFISTYLIITATGNSCKQWKHFLLFVKPENHMSIFMTFWGLSPPSKRKSYVCPPLTLLDVFWGLLLKILILDFILDKRANEEMLDETIFLQLH